MAKTSVSDRDRGLRALRKRLRDEQWTLTVGVHAEEGSQTTIASDSTTVLDVAIWNEYGTGHSPERSFIRDWADQQEARNEEALRKVAVAVLEGKYDAETGLERLGLLFVGEVQGRMAAGIPPPNAPSTVAQKGSSTPLIDNGQLRSSVLHRVRRGDADGS